MVAGKRKRVAFQISASKKANLSYSLPQGKNFVPEELPNSSETEDMRKFGRFRRTLQ